MFGNGSATGRQVLLSQLHQTQLWRPDQRTILELGASLARHLIDLNGNGCKLRDVSPGNVTIDIQTHECWLVNQEPVDVKALSEDVSKLACLPMQVIRKKPITSVGMTWQIGCWMLFLALGKNPFEGEDVFETGIRIREDDPDLHLAGEFGDLCNFILEQMRAGTDLKAFTEKMNERQNAGEVATDQRLIEENQKLREDFQKITAECKKAKEAQDELRSELAQKEQELEDAVKLEQMAQTDLQAALEKAEQEKQQLQEEFDELKRSNVFQQSIQIPAPPVMIKKQAPEESNDPFEALLSQAQSKYCTCEMESENLFQAAENDCLRCCATYIDQMGWNDLNDQGRTALMKAARIGHLEVVKLLAHKEAQKQDQFGQTALMLAASNGYRNLLKLLTHLEKGMKDENGHNALYQAYLASRQPCAELLWAVPEERDGLDDQQLQEVKSKFDFE